MTIFGVDEAWQRLTPAQLLAAGKTFVVVYVSEDTTGKNATPAEIRGYLDAGLGVLLVYEYSTTAVEGGAARGTHDAGIATAAARALGYPPGCAIVFAVDENETAHPSNVDGYAGAFTAAVRADGWRSMVYGGLATVTRCLDLGLVDLGWQTYAWSGTPTVWDPRAVIRQVQNGAIIDGQDVDLDVALVDDFGAWTLGGTMTDLIYGVDDQNSYAADRGVISGVIGGADPVTNIPWLGVQSSYPNLLWQLLRRLDAAAAADATRDAAMLAAIQALAAGGTSIDTTAVIGAINTAAADTHQTITALHDTVAAQQATIAALEAKLAKAAQDAAGDLAAG